VGVPGCLPRSRGAPPARRAGGGGAPPGGALKRRAARRPAPPPAGGRPRWSSKHGSLLLRSLSPFTRAPSPPDRRSVLPSSLPHPGRAARGCRPSARQQAWSTGPERAGPPAAACPPRRRRQRPARRAPRRAPVPHRARRPWTCSARCWAGSAARTAPAARSCGWTTPSAARATSARRPSAFCCAATTAASAAASSAARAPPTRCRRRATARTSSGGASATTVRARGASGKAGARQRRGWASAPAWAPPRAAPAAS
jgi:hypothetical protein